MLRPIVAQLIRDDRRYTELFDQVEYLLGLACDAGGGVGPVGLGAYRNRFTVKLPDRLAWSHRSVLVGAGVFTDKGHFEQCRSAYNDRFARASQRW
ncbi:MAG: hypothetical protein OXH86_17480 [Acidimicrobiaceae bacterium]|nr:hypothetical protein [Acidimicrobiaceae bacterium]MDE0499132.1 hypothetical protein [Acidimicrobiaceae bacterium]